MPASPVLEIETDIDTKGRGRPRSRGGALRRGLYSMMRLIPAPLDAVEVRTLATDQPAIADHLADLGVLLSAAEQARSARFLRGADRCAYIATRAALRMVLSERIGVAPEAIKLDQNSWGKPVLAAEHERHDLDFSVSHSGPLSVIALSRAGAVGVDIERHREVSDRDRILRDLLGERAALALAGLPRGSQNEAFLRLWTAAEAVLKAAGTGLAGNREPIPLALTPEGLPLLMPHRANARRRLLVPIDPSPGHVGSLVIEADGGPVPVCA